MLAAPSATPTNTTTPIVMPTDRRRRRRVLRPSRAPNARFTPRMRDLVPADAAHNAAPSEMAALNPSPEEGASTMSVSWFWMKLTTSAGAASPMLSMTAATSEASATRP